MEKILDNKYYDLIISNAQAPSYNTGDNITQLNSMHSLLHILKNNMNACDLGVNPYHTFPSIFTLESSVSIEKSGIDYVHNNPDLGLYGRGIIIGIVDTGIDYQHPAFMHNDNTTRIISIWDQTIEGGKPPPDFSFGTEYSKGLINFALISEDPLSIVPTVDTNRHGTAIASIAAGRPNDEYSFSGVAPQAELAVVKLKEAKENLKDIFFVPPNIPCYEESDIILGIRYLASVSQKLNRPIIICLALGSSQGGHDGRGAISAYLDYLIKLPKIDVIISAGNEGNNFRHYFNNTSFPPYFNEFQLNIGNNDKQFSMEIWPYTPGRLSIEIITPNRETSQTINPEFGVCHKITFQTSHSIIWVNNIIFEEESGEQLILLRFSNSNPGLWIIRVKSIDNEPFSFHSWLPSGNLISNETFFLNASPDTTITAPGNTTPPLTVTAYNQINGSILNESSRGYTRLGYVKPDVAAPGYQLSCAIPDNQYGMITGTGAAAAHTAGVAAMLTEWTYSKGNYTGITGDQVNRLIIRAAQRSSAYNYPNNIWGYGQLDAEKVFFRLLYS